MSQYIANKMTFYNYWCLDSLEMIYLNTNIYIYRVNEFS